MLSIRNKSRFMSVLVILSMALVFASPAAAQLAQVVSAAIGLGSCVGTDACFQNSGNVGNFSCNGTEACMQQSHNISDNSCNGNQACFQQNQLRSPGVPPCEFTNSCPTVGKNSCNGTKACLQNYGIVGDNSCNGDGVCIHETGVGDCQFNSVPVYACTTAGQIDNLTTTINGFNLSPEGAATGMNSKLQAAAAAFQANNTNAACGNVNAFINEVNAQSGKKLTTAQAQELLDSANQLKTSIGCP